MKFTKKQLLDVIKEEITGKNKLKQLQERKNQVEAELNKLTEQGFGFVNEIYDELASDRVGGSDDTAHHGFEEPSDDIHTKDINVHSNIITSKHGHTTINKPLISDAIKILSTEKGAIKFNSKEQFKDFLRKQKYFSASHSYCFYSPEEHDNWVKKHVAPSEDAFASDMVFETGHELVAIWDNKNSIGYIIPSNKLNEETYHFTLSHDNGKKNISTTADSEEAAIRKIM